jgi:hypothetical protein
LAKDEAKIMFKLAKQIIEKNLQEFDEEQEKK